MIEVEHLRTDATLNVDEVDIGVQLETKSQSHCDQVLAALRERGYALL